MKHQVKYYSIITLVILLIAGLSGCSTIGRNPALNKNKQEIKTAIINYYFTGRKKGDTTLLKEIFHPDARLITVANGQKAEESVEAYFKHVAAQGAVNCITEILDTDVTGTIAHAKTKFDYGAKIYVDYLNLIRTGEGWKIINKTYTQTK